ncbi:MAG: GNAT family N-acetyltransferase [Ginsengibacter sp.]
MILRKATSSELPVIWNILQQAIEQRKQDGSTQWQNGYPNEQTVLNDFTNGNAYVLLDHDLIIGCCAIIFGIEPTYIDIQGSWLTDGDYATIHRVAISNDVKGKGVATQMFTMIEALCIEQKVYSIKVDTNFDNVPMLKILDRLGYLYCGEILVSSAPRKAYEKVLRKI